MHFDVPQEISSQHGDDSGSVSMVLGFFHHCFERTKVLESVPDE